MGLWQKAVETYDAMAHRAGIVYEGEREPLAPISHITTQANIEITIDQDGNFLSAQAVDSKTAKIIIPVTEKSAGRTGKAAAERPHPLCDNIKYLLPQNKVQYRCYISQLSDWASSDYSSPKLQAILNYVQKGTILTDLIGAELVKLDQHGHASKDDLMICWVVNGLGERASGPCWEDQALMQAFTNYSIAKRSTIPPVPCMVSGEIAPPAGIHPKGIVPVNGNAKLISANDSSGFTYRGRFSEAWQAATVGYLSSQKAHCALRWLVANQGVAFGGRTFLCWNPRGCLVPEISHPMMRGRNQRAADPTQYRQQLHDSLAGWKENLPEQEGVVIAAFDAATATTGRLAIAYYNELSSSDFLRRICYWDETCCWENGPYGIQSPSLFQIVNYAFGTLRNGRLETGDRILGQQIQRLVACRIDRALFPADIEQALVEKASNLQLYQGDTEDVTAKLRRGLLFTACAAIRKYHIDHLKEDLSMGLDTENQDRSYLFGRLLAVAEATENSTYTGENRRETNAMRMQRSFALRPLSTWRALEEKLEPYYRQLNPGLREYYRKITQEIVDKLSTTADDLNQKLEDVYLIGYYHQRAYCKKKSNDPAEKKEEE